MPFAAVELHYGTYLWGIDGRLSLDPFLTGKWEGGGGLQGKVSFHPIQPGTRGTMPRTVPGRHSHTHPSNDARNTHLKGTQDRIRFLVRGGVLS